VEHIVASGLRILSGGRPKDQRFIFGSCKDAAYKAFIDFINAVNMATELSFDMPSTQEEWDTIYRQYKCKSANEIMAGCVACIDGFFQRCNRPTKKEVGNVISYQSPSLVSTTSSNVNPFAQFMSHSFSASFVAFMAAFVIPVLGGDGSAMLSPPSADLSTGADPTLVVALDASLVSAVGGRPSGGGA
jgi:hypothetical protein